MDISKLLAIKSRIPLAARRRSRIIRLWSIRYAYWRRHIIMATAICMAWRK